MSQNSALNGKGKQSVTKIGGGKRRKQKTNLPHEKENSKILKKKQKNYQTGNIKENIKNGYIPALNNLRS